MGNNASSSQQDRIAYQNFVANYAFIRKVKDPRYGEISILEDKNTKEHVALKEILCKSTTDFNREIEELKHRCKVSHHNIVRLIAYTSKAEDNLCASFYKILLILDYLEHDFEGDINTRKTNSEFYTEEQLWYILESVLSALISLQKKGTAHGDLKPSNIFISKVGVYKIAEQSLLGNVMPSYALRLSGFDDVRAYLSPALVQNLARQELYPKHDTFKSDIFTLGLSILHAATLTNCDKFYNWENFTLDVESLQRRVATLSQRYSEKFQRFVGSMLTLDENKRPSTSDLFDRIPSPDKQEEALLDQTPVQNEPKTHPTNKKQQATPIQVSGAEVNVASHGEEVSTRIQPGLGKVPHYTSKASPQENIVKDDLLNNKLNVRMGAKPSVLKEDIEPSPIKPLEEPNSDKLRVPEHKGSVPVNQSPFAQFNPRVSSGKKETAPLSQNPYIESLESQTVYSQPKIEAFCSGYKPSDEISRILNEYRSKDTVSTNAPQGRYEIPQTFSYSEPTTTKPEVVKNYSYTAIANTNATTNPKDTISAGIYSSISNTNTALPLSTTVVQGTQKSTQPQQQSAIYNTNTSYYKPSSDIERILQDIKNRNVGAKNIETNTNSNTVNNSETTSKTPSYNNLSGSNISSSYYQPSPIYSNPLNTQPYLSYHQTTGIQSQQQISPTPSVVISQTENTIKNNAPAIYQSKIYDQTSKPYEPSQKYERYSSAFENDQKYPTENKYRPTEADKYSHGNIGGLNSNTNYSAYSGNLTSSYTAMQDIKKSQYTQNENPQGQFEKENFIKYRVDAALQGISNGTKNEFTKQQASVTQQQQSYIPVSYSSNPLQPVSSNNQQQHRRQNSSSLTRPQLVETITEQYADGSVYEGQKQGNYRHGKGKFYYSDGGLYDGDWKAGSMDGHGTLHYGGGQIAYEGEWKDDKFHGKGIVYNEIPEPLQGEFDYSNFDNLADHWVKYEGGFLDDNKEGFGVLYLSNGDRFEGDFKDDMVHGRGTYIFANRQRFVGEWWNNRLV